MKKYYYKFLATFTIILCVIFTSLFLPLAIKHVTQKKLSYKHILALLSFGLYILSEYIFSYDYSPTNQILGKHENDHLIILQ